MSSHFVGFDPGGKDKFGWAIVLAHDVELEMKDGGVCSNAEEAMKAVLEWLNKQNASLPLGVGIDAPLYWISKGDRSADQHVRKLVIEKRGTSSNVNSVNSLRGACLVQGVFAARIAHKNWPRTQITEAHPKALLRVDTDASEWAKGLSGIANVEHIRDAAIAAYAAHSLVIGRNGWIDLADGDLDPFFPGGNKVSYFFPDQAKPFT